jgi:hypothetical protein
MMAKSSFFNLKSNGEIIDRFDTHIGKLNYDLPEKIFQLLQVLI